MSDVRYILEVPAFGVELQLDRLRREHNELIGELTVRCSLPAVRTIADHIVHIADFNLSSSRARSERAKVLKERVQLKDIDWFSALEDLCYRAFEQERLGEGAVDLANLPEPQKDESIEIQSFVFPKRSPTILFGDGGSGKSYFALYVAGQLHFQGMNVGYFDWECESEDHRRRLHRLFGDNLPHIFYCQCERPLHVEVDRLRFIARQHHLDYVVYDSIAFACDGPPEAAEAAAKYFRATRSIGIGSLHIAHVNKSEHHDQKPFGSIFWHNGARCTWYIQAATDNRHDGMVPLGFYNRKVNSGPLCSPIGMSLLFRPGKTEFLRTSLAECPELTAKLHIKDKMLQVLKRGPMSYQAIALALEENIESIRKTRNRNQNLFTTLEDGQIALLAPSRLKAGHVPDS